ncbi:MAPEG family protein [Halioglobus maricola]|uniref:MAPEG family protein n=1 Tax=Halioglobus maricola TaxID=2601894 RepID=A0A5P9NK12_9GAMM|nr:MAPEG family protein [Halioglobus maricola]QFU76181.1 MAPEG family protein [Halioglobus maricola]
MPIPETYHTALLGILVVVTTLVIQMMVAAVSKAKQPGAIPGKMDAELSHSSFVFRANRTFANSIDNAPALLGAAVLAILAGAGATWVAIWIWVYALARITHMALYYGISTEKNPSPRSHFFILGLIANIALIIQAGLALT